MLRLAKYLKPYLLLILIAIALLFVQANADLALPDYMSNIVNYGIQQGGVENAVPMAIRQTEMNKLFLFMSAADQNLVKGDYTLVEQNSADSASNIKQYPILASESIYVLKSIDKAEIARLNPILGKAFLVVSGIQQGLASPNTTTPTSPMAGLSTCFDPSKLPPGITTTPRVQPVPAASRGGYFFHSRETSR